MTPTQTDDELVDPIPSPEIRQIEVKVEPEVREVFLLDNRKPNSLAILEGARDELRRRGVKVHDEIYRKPNAAVAIEGELLGQLSQVRGLLLSGVND